jgi:A/G-specific adenine glycosylase
MLHAAAGRIVAEHDGRFPRSRDAVLALPGVGPYTGGAILSIAFDRPEPIVDGNIERVFARLTALDENVKAAPGRDAVWALASEHVKRGHKEGFSPSDLNQALMELGATVCTPVSPACDDCPVRRHCTARRSDSVHQYPVLPARAKTREKRYRFVALRDGKQRILLVRRREGDSTSLLPGGLWELPHAEPSGLSALADQVGVPVRHTGKTLTRRHSIMNYRLTLELRSGLSDSPVNQTPNRRWFTLEQAGKAAIASATRKLLLALETSGRQA